MKRDVAQIDRASRVATREAAEAHAAKLAAAQAAAEQAARAAKAKAAALAAQKTNPAPAPARRTIAPPVASGSMAVVVAYAYAQLGKPYVWAAVGPNGFDCSGLVVAAYRQIGIGLPHQTGDLIAKGHPVSRSELRPGDLVFPSSGHVGIAIGNGKMIHAPQPGQSVEISDIYSFWAARRL